MTENKKIADNLKRSEAFHRKIIENAAGVPFRVLFDLDTGEGYYCPIDALAEDRQMSEKGLDDCVEVSTAGRYSGNLNLTDR